MTKSSNKTQIALDKMTNIVYNTDMLRDNNNTKENKMFTVVKELRFNGVHNRYLMNNVLMNQYYIGVSSSKLNVGDTLNTIRTEAKGSKEYLLKTYN